MFTILYELVIGKNADPIYRNTIFLPIGAFTVSIMLVLSFLFYVVLGRWRAVFHRNSHWVWTLLFGLVVVFWLTLSFAQNATGEPHVNAYMLGLGGINIGIALLSFVGASLFFRRGSKYARHTPQVNW